MGIAELLLIAAGLSMDAFAVSVCKGLSVRRLRLRHYLMTGAWFGGFQALMPVVGYLFGSAFAAQIARFDHWVTFLLLCLIGGSMIGEALSKEEPQADDSFRAGAMCTLAVATSIDALAVGITFALLPAVPLLPAVSLIGIITFFLSALGLRLGNLFGLKYRSGAELAGGIILILIGLKILLEHLGYRLF